ncbi:MAG: hypothetical protein M0R03_13045, partial [Novosphingobium sp.]|nr:hypothetical protein [Novosphingobium sp.]
TQDESRNIDRCWKIIKIEDFLYFDNNGRCAEETLFFSVNDIIFSHEFAKAFFGDKKYVQSFNPAYYTYRNTDKKLWEEHLQNMILMNNDTRVRYLENWL